MNTLGNCRYLTSPLMDAEAYAGWVTAAELQRAESFGSAHRRAEYLTWRALVRQHYGRELEFAYNDLGAPCIVQHPHLYLSVTHDADAVAVLVSEHRCGIDMERKERRFQAIRTKYLTDEEAALSTHPHFLAIAWCAKEALYKYAGEQGLRFKEDLRLLSFAPERAEGQLQAKIKDGEPLRLTVCEEANRVVVYLIAD